ncbi:feruloyl-CoA synthetase [Thioclava sp. SK-1]|uniref:feruloyl-CoA synthase n=1 Tax=Thioclava sp. SK-1 TaxID=1889770 RepID=UPI000825AF13|nr:feruloyl-CoA synthase [Thioclava sp. SK-1]OCX67346.1 feruloyl-CoA synthetase [Thioclava sp. SK-1]
MKDVVTGLTLVPHSAELCEFTGLDGRQGLLMTTQTPLDRVVDHTGVWLEHWAATAPDRIFLAERSGDEWRELSYATVLAQVKAVAAALVARRMGAQTPILILSGNSVNHAILSYAAQWVGVPTVPLAEQYALINEAHFRITYAAEVVRPGLIFVEDAARFADALALPALQGIEVVASDPSSATTAFADLLAVVPDAQTAAAHAQVGPDTLAKILFTSGSTSNPKGVMTTQRMMCANQSQMASVLPFLKQRPPKIVDWLPWNHVFGGSHNLNMMLAHGGSFYIDNGKPTKALFGDTIANVTHHAGNLSFNVPVGFSMLVQEMETNAALRQAYFHDLDMIFYAGASLPQEVWTRLEEMALQEQGRLPLMISSWGMTETAPATVMVHEPIGRSGVIGVPLPGTQIRLIPDADMRCELRVKGPNIMPGYVHDPEKTAQAFDEDGFLITGDAVRFVNPDDPARGLVFDGRVSEDFKLLTGTWVQAGKLRVDALEALRGLVQDVVICGHDRGEIGLFVFPKPSALEHGDVSDGALIDPDLMARIHHVLRDMARASSGSARRIARAIVLAEPPSVKDAEVTDKGSLNTRKIITRRTALLERLYDNDDPALIRV